MIKRRKSPHPKAPWVTAKPTKKPRRWIRPMSAKRETDAREYSKRRKAFLIVRPVCEVCMDLGTKPPRPSVHVHHMAGRKGPNYLDDKTWLAVCAKHHDKIHRNPAWAIEYGYLRSFIK